MLDCVKGGGIDFCLKDDRDMGNGEVRRVSYSSKKTC